MRRKTLLVSEKVIRKAITADAVEENGKKYPAKLPSSGIDTDEDDKEKEVAGTSKNIYVPLVKMNMDEQTVTGVVLQPEVVDAQGDIIGVDVIRNAAHNFLAKYNKATQLGLQHKHFGKYKFELYESWIAPQDVVLNSTLVKAGSWIMTVKVHSAKIWKMVKNGDLKGFSIGGKAKVQKIEKGAQ